MPAKLGGGGVCDSTCRFHEASPALNRPALSPTRGSGFGAVADVETMDPFVEGALAVEEIALLHAAAESTPMASDSLYTADWVMDTVVWEVVTAG